MLRCCCCRFSFISREFDKSGELHSAVEHPEKYASGMMTMVHNPSERMIRQVRDWPRVGDRQAAV